MTTKNIKNQGFTLVELLIVIVIIAILTVVSLVAYNGLQNQAKTSAAKSTVDTVAKKAELYNTEEGKYPEDITKLTGADTKKSYYIAPANVTELGTGTLVQALQLQQLNTKNVLLPVLATQQAQRFHTTTTVVILSRTA